MPVLDLPGLDRAVGEFVSQYNQRTHTGIRTSPKAAWIAEGWLPRLPESLEELDGLLLRVSKHRTVQRDGVVSRGMRGVAADWGPLVSRKKRHEMMAWTSKQKYCTPLSSTRPRARPEDLVVPRGIVDLRPRLRPGMPPGPLPHTVPGMVTEVSAPRGAAPR